MGRIRYPNKNNRRTFPAIEQAKEFKDTRPYLAKGELIIVKVVETVEIVG